MSDLSNTLIERIYESHRKLNSIRQRNTRKYFIVGAHHFHLPLLNRHRTPNTNIKWPLSPLVNFSITFLPYFNYASVNSMLNELHWLDLFGSPHPSLGMYSMPSLSPIAAFVFLPNDNLPSFLLFSLPPIEPRWWSNDNTDNDVERKKMTSISELSWFRWISSIHRTTLAFGNMKIVHLAFERCCVNKKENLGRAEKTKIV